MEVKITTEHFLKVLQILSWIIFIGLCVVAGGIVFNTIMTLFYKPQGTEYFLGGSDYLVPLYNIDRGHFYVMSLTMTIVAVLKAIMFYLIVKLFTDKKITLSQPFSIELRRFILNLCYLALGIAMFCQYGYKYSVRLTKQGVNSADLQSLHIAGADVWLFMAVILFVIVQVVKRGIEIQNENDLTI